MSQAAPRLLWLTLRLPRTLHDITSDSSATSEKRLRTGTRCYGYTARQTSTRRKQRTLANAHTTVIRLQQESELTDEEAL